MSGVGLLRNVNQSLKKEIGDIEQWCHVWDHTFSHWINHAGENSAAEVAYVSAQFRGGRCLRTTIQILLGQCIFHQS